MVQAPNDDSERVFSSGGNTESDQRTSLTEDIIVLK